MSTNNLPLLDSDLDLLSKMADAYFVANMCSMDNLNTQEFGRLYEITELLWHAQAQNAAQGPVFESETHRFLHEQKSTVA